MSSSWNSPIRKSLAVAACAALSASPAYAVDKPPEKPPEISSAIKDAQPYGAGSLGWFVITAYDASLWTDAPQWSWQTPFALSLQYHLSFSASDIVDRSLTEEKHDDPAIGTDTLAKFRTMMSGLFPDVKSGDELTALYTPDGTVQVFHNGQAVGEVHDRAFAKAFFGIWLSPQTSEPKLRAKLLNL